MQLIPLVCNHCGAPIEAAAAANFLTCGHCGSRLRVVRTDSSTSTELLSAVHRNTQEISVDLRLLRLRKEMEDLEADWAAWVRDNHVADLDRVPDADLPMASVGMRFIGNVAALVVVVLACLSGQYIWMLAAPLCIAIAHLLGTHSSRKAAIFQENRDRYRADIGRIRSEMDTAKAMLAQL